MDRNAVSASVYVVLVVAAIASRIWPLPLVRDVGVALSVVFLALEISRTPNLQRNVGLFLTALGVFAAWRGGDLAGALYEALVRAQVFLVMFFAVMWLRDPAITSPSLRDLRDAVIRQPAGRRYPILWLSSHFLGAVLNLAAMSLLSAMAAEQTDRRLQRRLAIALMMGFTTASSWGPFYVSIAVILAAIPSVSWIDIAPLGLLLSVFMLAVGWSYDRLVLRQAPAPGSRLEVVPLTAKTVGRAALILALLSVFVLAAHQIANLSIPVALGVIGPPFAIAWIMVQAPAGAAWRRGGRPLVGRIFRAVPDLRNEAVAFTAASVFGLGMAKVLPPDVIGDVLLRWGLGPDAVVVMVIVGMTLASCVGLHPVILVILVGEVLPPEVIGIPAPVLAIAMLGVWGTSTMVSPFSATTLFMSRIVNVPSHIIAWRWSIPVVSITTLVVAAYVVILRHLLYA